MTAAGTIVHRRAGARWAGGCGVLSLLLGAANGRAAEEERAPFLLAYDAPAGCPSRQEFVAEARSFLSRSHVEVAAPRHFDVTLVKESDSSSRGQLVIEAKTGEAGIREASGPTCREVADVLAFALALSVDPNATPADVPAPAPPPRPPPRSAVPPPSAQPPSPRPRLQDAMATPEGARWGLSAHAAVASADAPAPLYGVGLSATLVAQVGPLAPSFRLGAEYGAAQSQPEDGGYVAFARVIAIAEGCPTQLGGQTLSARLCLRFEGGAHLTSGDGGVPAAQSAVRPWIALGPTAHVGARIFGPLSLDVGGGVVFPIVRDHVYIGPSQPVYTAAAIGGLGEVGLGLAFP